MGWVEAFVAETDYVPSPKIFRQWGAISAVAGALERRVWVNTPGVLYPNLYVLLLGPPGVGKTETSWRVQQLMSMLDDHHTAPSNMTKAAFIDALNDASRIILQEEDSVEYNSLYIISNELGTLIDSYNREFLGTLTDLYDCKGYTERKRTAKLNITIDKPQVNMLASATPAWLSDIMPEGAWDQGFLSRVIIVFSGDNSPKPLFGSTNTGLSEALQESFTEIGELHGEMEFTTEAAKLANDWHMAGGPKRPDHPRLNNYNTRRTAHLLKLMMIACASDFGHLTITADHYRTALGWLLDAEHYMTDVFKAMVVGGDSRVMEETWHYVRQRSAKTPLSQAAVYRFVAERTPAYNINHIMDAMLKTGLLVSSHPEFPLKGPFKAGVVG